MYQDGLWKSSLVFKFILDNFYLIGKDKGDIYQNIKYGHEHKYSSDGVSLSKLFILFETTVSRKSCLSLLYFFYLHLNKSCIDKKGQLQ